MVKHTHATVKGMPTSEYQKQYKQTDKYKRRRKLKLRHYLCYCGGRYDSKHKTYHFASKKHKLCDANMHPSKDFTVPPFTDLDDYTVVF